MTGYSVETERIPVAYDPKRGMILEPQAERLMGDISREIKSIRFRHPAFAIRHLILNKREFPGDVDKYHKCGVEIRERYFAVQREIVEAAKLWVEMGDAERSFARWKVLRFVLPDRARRKMAYYQAYLQERRIRLEELATDANELVREMAEFNDLRLDYKGKVIAGGGALHWDDNEETRWKAVISSDPQGAKIAEKIDLAAMGGTVRDGRVDFGTALKIELVKERGI